MLFFIIFFSFFYFFSSRENSNKFHLTLFNFIWNVICDLCAGYCCCSELQHFWHFFFLLSLTFLPSAISISRSLVLCVLFEKNYLHIQADAETTWSFTSSDSRYIWTVRPLLLYILHHFVCNKRAHNSTEIL